MPPLPDPIDERLRSVGARRSEVEESFVKGSGPGGQKINKTSSTVVLRHGPTGIQVRSQAERSQAANRERAWTLLCERLEARRTQEAAERQSAVELDRRRNRRKSAGQKRRMVESKRRSARQRSERRGGLQN